MYSEGHSGSLEIAMRIVVLILCFSLLGCAKPARFASVIPEMITVEGEEFEVKTIVVGDDTCIAPGSLDTSLSQAAGLSDVVACHARRA